MSCMGVHIWMMSPKGRNVSLNSKENRDHRLKLEDRGDGEDNKLNSYQPFDPNIGMDRKQSRTGGLGEVQEDNRSDSCSNHHSEPNYFDETLEKERYENDNHEEQNVNQTGDNIPPKYPSERKRETNSPHEESVTLSNPDTLTKNKVSKFLNKKATLVYAVIHFASRGIECTLRSVNLRKLLEQLQEEVVLQVKEVNKLKQCLRKDEGGTEECCECLNEMLQEKTVDELGSFIDVLQKFPGTTKLAHWIRKIQQICHNVYSNQRNDTGNDSSTHEAAGISAEITTRFHGRRLPEVDIVERINERPSNFLKKVSVDGWDAKAKQSCIQISLSVEDKWELGNLQNCIKCGLYNAKLRLWLKENGYKVTEDTHFETTLTVKDNLTEKGVIMAYHSESAPTWSKDGLDEDIKKDQSSYQSTVCPTVTRRETVECPKQEPSKNNKNAAIKTDLYPKSQIAFLAIILILQIVEVIQLLRRTEYEKPTNAMPEYVGDKMDTSSGSDGKLQLDKNLQDAMRLWLKEEIKQGDLTYLKPEKHELPVDRVSRPGAVCESSTSVVSGELAPRTTSDQSTMNGEILAELKALRSQISSWKRRGQHTDTALQGSTSSQQTFHEVKKCAVESERFRAMMIGQSLDSMADASEPVHHSENSIFNIREGKSIVAKVTNNPTKWMNAYLSKNPP